LYKSGTPPEGSPRLEVLQYIYWNPPGGFTLVEPQEVTQEWNPPGGFTLVEPLRRFHKSEIPGSSTRVQVETVTRFHRSGTQEVS